MYGLAQGEWKYYYDSGELKRTENYGNLCLLSITNYSQNGNIINETDNFLSVGQATKMIFKRGVHE